MARNKINKKLLRIVLTLWLMVLQLGLFQFYNPSSNDLQEYLIKQTESSQIFPSDALIVSEGIIPVVSETIKINTLLEIKYELRFTSIINSSSSDHYKVSDRIKIRIKIPNKNLELNRVFSPRSPPAFLS